jgi:hypothetical protein
MRLAGKRLNGELSLLLATPTLRVGALEKLLERIIRQKPVSEKQLHQTLKNSGVNPPPPGP